MKNLYFSPVGELFFSEFVVDIGGVKYLQRGLELVPALEFPYDYIEYSEQVIKNKEGVVFLLMVKQSGNLPVNYSMVALTEPRHESIVRKMLNEGDVSYLSFNDSTRHHEVFEAVYMQASDPNYPTDVLSLPDINRNDLSSCVGLCKELNNQNFDPTDPLSYSVYDVVDDSFDFTTKEVIFNYVAFSLKERKAEAKHQIDAMLESVLQNEVFVSAIVSVGGQRKRVKIQSDLDTLQEIVQDGVNNGDTFSFADRDDSLDAYWFENIKKSVAQELLKAVSDFKLKRSGSFRLEWYGKINHANSISEIQQIINDFSDIENNGSDGWSFENGQLIFNLAQDIDQIKVFAFLPAKTDVTSQFVSGLPDA